MLTKPGIWTREAMLTTVKQTIQTATEIVERSPRFYIWLSVLIALLFLAGFALLASLITSMEILEFSIRVPWAGLIATYVFLVASGSGLCLINALGAVFGMHRYEMMAKRMAFLSLTTIIFGMLCIVMHLGHPERMPIYNAISPNFHSAISWMGALYSIYLVFVAIELWLLIRPELIERAERARGLEKKVFSMLALTMVDELRFGAVLKDSRLHRVVGALAFVTGASALAMLGSVFAHSESRLFWYGPYYPVYFLLSALFSGYAFLLAVIIITYRVRGYEIFPELKALIFEMARVLALLLAVGCTLIAFRVFTGALNPLGPGPVMLLLTGAFSWAFWVFEIGLMSVIPAYVLLWAAWKKSLPGVLAGAVMVLIGTFVMR
ncbi:MAG: polysulfide reductase NrfD, partial [Clostridia bacterium]|nr:polysulfide reductase NrfD [Clostridia bacterium]